MTRTVRSPKFLALQRRQLDAKLAHTKPLSSPSGGWIHTVRLALGMSLSQLGKRLGMTQQGALDLERREASDTITIAKLKEAARALDCDVHVLVVPRQSLDATVRRQADAKARAERSSIVHTMRLEAQDEGVDETLKEGTSRDVWLTTRAARLWD